MDELSCDPRFQAGDVALEAEYYRLHYGTTLRDVDLLDAVIRRLRPAFTDRASSPPARSKPVSTRRPGTCDDYDLIPALAQLDIPTLIIHGDDDFVPIPVVGRIAAAIPGALMAVLPDCGHFAYLEQPDRTCATITSFLTSQ